MEHLLGVLIGFIAGYRGGIVDEVLNMLTNIVLVIPSLVVLLIIAAYLEVRGVLVRKHLHWVFAWPWAARAIRAQTFSLRSREFVDLAQAERNEALKDHLHGDRAEHDVLSVNGLHPSVWRGDTHGCHTGFHRPWSNECGFAWSHDEHRGPLGRSYAWYVVVVRSTGCLRSRPSWERCMSRTLDWTKSSTPNSGRCEDVSLQVENLTVYYQTLRGDVRALEAQHSPSRMGKSWDWLVNRAAEKPRSATA